MTGTFGSPRRLSDTGLSGSLTTCGTRVSPGWWPTRGPRDGPTKQAPTCGLTSSTST